MGYGFLLDHDRKLLSIGYRVPEGALDPSCYDLLASEARLASFIAIAKGDVPARHWFRLGRAVTPIAHRAALISWSGSMFEYLMPSLIMRAPAGSLFEQTSRLIVRRQIAYGTSLRLPWGMSESAYNTRDLEFTYQYSNFGVPGLGLKRGLGENVVVAPYATALATMVDPTAAARNFALLASVGARGRYGFYEALDYTPSRLPEDANVAIVRAFMAHHQGMTIVAIADALLDGVMRARFHAEPMVQATELLLQEGTPRDVAVVRPWAVDGKSDARVRENGLPGGRRLTSAHTAALATHLLSNGRYAVMLTAAGSGYSRWRGLAVTRWREDSTCDDWGSYVFLRDVRSGDVWSAGFQPSGAEPDAYNVAFNEDRAEFTRHDGTLTTTLEVLVSAEDDAEVRRVSIANSGNRVREIDVTSYAELVLAPQADDVAHPAFMKLFVATEYLAGLGTILATRRRRSPTEQEIWAAHLAVVDGEAVGQPEVETDRARFLGRGHGIQRPIAMIDGRPLSNTVGTVLDPVFALRRRVRVAPGAIVRIAFWTVVAASREAVLDLVDKHRDTTAFERAATLAWTQAQVQLHHLGIDPGEAGLFQRLAGHLLYAGPTLRPSSDTILRGGGGQPGLWPMGISGDLPIVLLRIADMENLDIARQLLQAHEYWRMKQLAVDLVILNERASSYVQDLQIALETLVRTSQSPPPDRRGATAGPRLRAAGRPDSGGDPCLARVGGAGRSGRAARHASPISSTVCRNPRKPSGPLESGRRLARNAGRAAPARPRVLQRARRLRRRWPGICDDPRARPVDAGAVDQCHRQSRIRLSGGDRRRRLHLVGQQPREPAHPLVQRSGQRSPGRGLLSARRRHRRPVVPDGAADPRRQRHLCGSAWPGIQPVRACGARHRRRVAAVRAARRSDQDLAPHAAQHIAPHAASLGDRLCGMGAWSVARGLRAVRDDRDRSRHRRDVRAQSVERRLRIARRLRRSWRAADRLDGRPAGVHRPQRDTGKPGGARRRGTAVQHRGRRPRSLRRAADERSCCRRMRRIEIVFFLGEAASAQDARAL